jgi:hypothetical protein
MSERYRLFRIPGRDMVWVGGEVPPACKVTNKGGHHSEYWAGPRGL